MLDNDVAVYVYGENVILSILFTRCSHSSGKGAIDVPKVLICQFNNRKSAGNIPDAKTHKKFIPNRLALYILL